MRRRDEACGAFFVCTKAAALWRILLQRAAEKKMMIGFVIYR